MKRAIALLLAVVMVWALCACGSSKELTAEEKEAIYAEVAAQKAAENETDIQQADVVSEDETSETENESDKEATSEENNHEDEANTEALSEDVAPIVETPALTVGSTINLGIYASEIEWIVLEIKENKALLISKTCLDYMQFDNEDNEEDSTWAESDIREMLNSDFIRHAFSADELAMICETTIQTPANDISGFTGGDDTLDRVFVLSAEEAKTYFKSASDLRAARTSYAETRQTAYMKSALGSNYYGSAPQTSWWLRSSYSSWEKYQVAYDGTIAVSHKRNAAFVRPCIWIDLDIYNAVKG